MVREKGAGRRLVLLVLGVLHDGPAHGYGIVREVAERSNGVLHLEEGLVYPLLHELERAGLIESRWEDGGRRRRKVYTLTADGAARHAVELARWQSETDAVAAVLRPTRAEGGATHVVVG